MFDKNMEDRQRAWSDFRNNLEDEPDPFKSTIELYNLAPLVTYNIDPDSPMTWPNPWELLNENQYDDLGYILGIGYTLGLTDRFSSSVFEIHITQDKEKSRQYYLLHVDDKVIGFDRKGPVCQNELPSTLFVESIHRLRLDY
jgi:hypothetical protein